MTTTNFDQILLNNHFDLLKNLSQYQKMELISWLSQSLKSISSEENSLRPLFGAFQSEQTAEQLIAEIQQSRLFNQERETAIAGFIITGSEAQQVIIRGIAIDAGVDPALILFKRNGSIWTEIAVNDEWENDNNATAVTELASHLQLPDRNGNDAGLLIDLKPGIYTVQMGSNDGAGLAVIGVDTIE